MKKCVHWWLVGRERNEAIQRSHRLNLLDFRSSGYIGAGRHFSLVILLLSFFFTVPPNYAKLEENRRQLSPSTSLLADLTLVELRLLRHVLLDLEQQLRVLESDDLVYVAEPSLHQAQLALDAHVSESDELPDEVLAARLEVERHDLDVLVLGRLDDLESAGSVRENREDRAVPVRAEDKEGNMSNFRARTNGSNECSRANSKDLESISPISTGVGHLPVARGAQSPILHLFHSLIPTARERETNRGRTSPGPSAVITCSGLCRTSSVSSRKSAGTP